MLRDRRRFAVVEEEPENRINGEIVRRGIRSTDRWHVPRFDTTEIRKGSCPTNMLEGLRIPRSSPSAFWTRLLPTLVRGLRHRHRQPRLVRESSRAVSKRATKPRSFSRPASRPRPINLSYSIFATKGSRASVLDFAPFTTKVDQSAKSRFPVSDRNGLDR